MSTDIQLKKEYYASIGITANNTTIVDGNISRSATEKEFEQLLSSWSSPEEHIQIQSQISANTAYKGQRIPLYPHEEEQIDAIYKGFKYLSDNGTDIGPECQAWIDTITEIKTKYPRPSANT